MTPYGLQLVTGPVEEPVTTAELKAHLRIDHTEEDDVIAGFNEAAREYVESRTSRQLVTATWRVLIDRFPGRTLDDVYVPLTWRYGIIRIPRAPLQSVTSVKYVDTDGVEQTVPTTDYQVDSTREPGKIMPARFKVWPVTDPLTLSAVRVVFVAGFGAAAAVPRRFKQAIKMLAAHWYENRENTITGTIIAEVPKGVDALINNLGYGELS